MDSFEINKMAGALLAVVFVAMGVGIIGDAIFDSPVPDRPGYLIEAAEGAHGTDKGNEKAAEGPEAINALLASADSAAGEKVFKKCAACHTVEDGGANKVGPNLWNIVNRPVASHEGFNYSSALTEYSDGGKVTWTYDQINHFVWKPKDLVKGTAMGYAGLKSVEDRANLVAYLRDLSPSPAPLPEATSDTPTEVDENATPEAPVDTPHDSSE